ncbi:STAS domain-containing protein [Sphaerisporangium perillae]|uniref:STAS domain-containing protein n=1 Tax=Sphaerisporangium perillae TaxID=2935860 RepID=UPI00200D3EE3|nr:STAS domain-containing protein [Sphaerisporangium perillae]
MSAQLKVSIAYRPPVAVLVLAGELDLASADLLAGSVDDLLRRGQKHFAVDVSDLRFCDSTGLDAILDARERAAGAGGSLRLVGVRGILGRILEITRSQHPFEPDDIVGGLWAVPARGAGPVRVPEQAATPSKGFTKPVLGRPRGLFPRPQAASRV